MCWATSIHHRNLTTLLALESANTNIPLPIVCHPTLSHLPPESCQGAAAVVFKNEFVKITNTQLLWNKGLLDVFVQTPIQDGDEDLKKTWASQLSYILNLHGEGKISMVPGDLDIPIRAEVIQPDDTEQAMKQEDVQVQEDHGEHHSVNIYDPERDGDSDSSSDSEDDDQVSGLVHQIDLVDISCAVDPTTLFI